MSLHAAFIDTLRQLGRNTDALMLIVVAALFYGFYSPRPTARAMRRMCGLRWLTKRAPRSAASSPT